MKVYYTCDPCIILTLQWDNWLAASPDGLVLDCSDYDNTFGLLEIKCPARAEKISLVDLCTKRELKPLSFFLQYIDRKFYLKTTHSYYYQVQGQLYITGRPWCDSWFGPRHIHLWSAYGSKVSCGVRRYTLD